MDGIGSIQLWTLDPKKRNIWIYNNVTGEFGSIRVDLGFAVYFVCMSTCTVSQQPKDEVIGWI